MIYNLPLEYLIIISNDIIIRYSKNLPFAEILVHIF